MSNEAADGMDGASETGWDPTCALAIRLMPIAEQRNRCNCHLVQCQCISLTATGLECNLTSGLSLRSFLQRNLKLEGYPVALSGQFDVGAGGDVRFAIAQVQLTGNRLAPEGQQNVSGMQARQRGRAVLVDANHAHTLFGARYRRRRRVGVFGTEPAADYASM